MFFHEVCDKIRKLQPRRDFHMGGHEIADNGQDMEPAKQRRCGNGQLASRTSVFASSLNLGVGKTFKNASH